MEVHKTPRNVKLYEISDGIFSLTPSVNTGNAGKPLVAVHTYFEFPSYWDCEKSGQDFYGQEVEGIGKGYLNALDDLISEHPGPLINCESNCRIFSNADHYAKNLRRKKDTYFIKTGKYTAKAAAPASIEIKDAVRFMTQFKGSPIMMVGGAFHEKALRVLRGEGKWEHYFKTEPIDTEPGSFLSFGSLGPEVGCGTQWLYWLSTLPENKREIIVDEKRIFPLLLKEGQPGYPF